MNISTVEKMCCPTDGSSLELHSFSARDKLVDEGIIVCPICGDAWTIISGIPRFISESSIDLFLDLHFVNENREAIDSYRTGLADQLVLKIESLRNISTDRSDWKLDEMIYWEEYYGHRYETDKENKTTYNRILPRRKYILRPLYREPIKNVIEIGCGTCGTMYNNKFFINNKEFIGTDLSFNALRFAQRFVTGTFIMCDASTLPFKKGVFDLVLCFGLLHHLEQREKVLPSLFEIVRPGGYLGFSEKLRSSQKVRNSNLFRLAMHFFNRKERDHSEDEYIEDENALSICSRLGTIRSKAYEYSAVRDLMVKILVDKMKINNKGITEAMMFVDQLAIRLLGSGFPLMAGNAIHVLTKKYSDA